ncbi:hypothetical protein K710_1990 [Streptococcus iniae SF1]|nr:hypothetical protein K710_1990 [Streptococcus iniae SF1]
MSYLSILFQIEEKFILDGFSSIFFRRFWERKKLLEILL